jgi:murein DD-endopeptidase MepM/ murein hydrolase activator NlpD
VNSYISSKIFKIIILLFLISFIQACLRSPLPFPDTKPKGIYHTVKKDRTLWRICRRYKVSLQDVAEINNIQKTSQIKAGDKIFIPGAKRVLWVRPVTKTPAKQTAKKTTVKKKKRRTSSKKTYPKKIISHSGMFKWPVNGTVIKRFGIYNKTKHDGINIKASSGTAIKAASPGKVIFSSFLEGYGNTVIIQHKNSFVTVYGNNRANLAGIGRTVKTGDKIATVGTSAGKSKTPYLHFQVRKYDAPRNPAFYLPNK